MSTHHVAHTENTSSDGEADDHGPCPQRVYKLVGRVVMKVKNCNTGQAREDGVQRLDGLTLTRRKAG